MRGYLYGQATHPLTITCDLCNISSVGRVCSSKLQRSSGDLAQLDYFPFGKTRQA